MPPAVYATLAIVVMVPIAWFLSEFQERRWLRILLGSISISLCFAVAVLVGKLERWNENAWYGFASKSLIEATIAGLESGEAERVLATYKRLQSEFSPTYENRARYDELVEKVVSEMRSEEQSSQTGE